MSPRKHEFSPTPSEVLRYFLVWFRGFHRDREKSKAADWAMVGLTFFTLVAAIVSAWFFQAQLVEARNSTDATRNDFRVDERAWIELEIKPDQKGRYRIYPKNIGKTVARNIVTRIVSTKSISLFVSPARIACYQRYMTDEAIREAEGEPGEETCGDPQEWTEKEIEVSNPRVLAPNETSPVPVYQKWESPPAKFPPYVFIGRVDYLDAFNIPHWRTFCLWTNERGEFADTCNDGNQEDDNSE